jgi:hypothetical protein
MRLRRPTTRYVSTATPNLKRPWPSGRLTPIPFNVTAARMARGNGLIKAGRAEAGVAELSDDVAWFRNSRLSHLHLFATLWLVENLLAIGARSTARVLVDEVLNFTRASGYLHFEGVTYRLIGECLTVEDPAAATAHIETAVGILEGVGARNDFAKALACAKLRQTSRVVAVAGELLTAFIRPGPAAEQRRLQKLPSPITRTYSRN